MTPATKPVTRLTTTLVRDRSRTRQLVVTIAPEGVYYRLKGTRTAYLQPHADGYYHAAKLEGDRVRRERMAERKARKAARGKAR